jgi:hypothetical protein
MPFPAQSAHIRQRDTPAGLLTPVADVPTGKNSRLSFSRTGCTPRPWSPPFAAADRQSTSVQPLQRFRCLLHFYSHVPFRTYAYTWCTHPTPLYAILRTPPPTLLYLYMRCSKVVLRVSLPISSRSSFVQRSNQRPPVPVPPPSQQPFLSPVQNQFRPAPSVTGRSHPRL